MPTIRQDKGRYLYVQFYDPATGKRPLVATGKLNNRAGVSEVKKMLKNKEIRADFEPKKETEKTDVFREMEKLYFSKVQLQPGTVEVRGYALGHWKRICGVKKIEDYTEKDCQKFTEALKDKAQNTIAIYTSELHSFFNWFLEHNYIRENPIRITKRIIKDPRIIPENDLIKLLRYFYVKPNKRQFALLFFLLNCGCRKSDALALEWKNIDWSNGIIYIRNIKKDRNYSIPLTDKIAIALKMVEGLYDESVFGYKRDSLKFYWEAQKKLWGKNRYTMHQLRKTYITTLLQKEYDLDTVMKLTNHKDVETISKYYSVAVVKGYKERLNRIGVISDDMAHSIFTNI